MRPVLSPDQMRAFDRAQIEAGVPGIVLMENAGRGAAHLIGLKIRPRAPGTPPRTGTSVAGSCVRCADERSLARTKVVILCGGGNNGGDGFVVARHLSSRACEVLVYSTHSEEHYLGDARLALNAMKAGGIALKALPRAAESSQVFWEADLVVDALLGTGAARLLEGELSEIVDAVNASGVRVISLDLPTGLDADTGRVLGTAIRAEHTVSFAHLKKGLLTTHGQTHAGTITVSHIGVSSSLPKELSPSAYLLEEGDLLSLVSPRERTAHKGTSGRVAIVSGSPGTVGAARLASRACLRTGAGLVTVASDSETAKLLESEVLEVMTRSLEDSEKDRDFFLSCDALVVGPGLGVSGAGEKIRSALQVEKPCVVDADALRWLAELSAAEFTALSAQELILTPHPGEAAALLDRSVEEIESDRFEAAAALAERYRSVVVLKGSRTIVAAPNQTSVVSAFGSPTLATGGTGDVLAGVLGALLAERGSGRTLFESALLAVAVHALAAERWQELHGDRGLLAHEVADGIPEVLEALL